MSEKVKGSLLKPYLQHNQNAVLMIFICSIHILVSVIKSSINIWPLSLLIFKASLPSLHSLIKSKKFSNFFFDFLIIISQNSNCKNWTDWSYYFQNPYLLFNLGVAWDDGNLSILDLRSVELDKSNNLKPLYNICKEGEAWIAIKLLPDTIRSYGCFEKSGIYGYRFTDNGKLNSLKHIWV